MTFSSVNCARNVRDDSFSFYCAECHFSLHSHCDRSIPTTLQHSRHTHPFILCILLELFFYARDILLLYYSQLPYLPRLWYSLFAIYRQTQDTHTSTQLTFYPPPIKENPEDEDEDEDKLKLSFYPCMKENPEDKDKDKDEHKDEDEDKDATRMRMRMWTSTIMMLVNNHDRHMDCSISAKSVTLLLMHRVLPLQFN
ncbi:unnamed protein product [Camellia sinensis]